MGAFDIVSGFNSYQAGKKASKETMANARREAKRSKLLGDKKIASDTTVIAKGGLTMDSFSDVITESIMNNEYNASQIMTEGSRIARGQRDAGFSALASGVLGTVGFFGFGDGKDLFDFGSGEKDKSSKNEDEIGVKKNA